jgi:hypothetical protein
LVLVELAGVVLALKGPMVQTQRLEILLALVVVAAAPSLMLLALTGDLPGDRDQQQHLLDRELPARATMAVPQTAGHSTMAPEGVVGIKLLEPPVQTPPVGTAVLDIMRVPSTLGTYLGVAAARYMVAVEEHQPQV